MPLSNKTLSKPGFIKNPGMLFFSGLSGKNENVCPIICFSNFEWDFLLHRSHQILMEARKHNTVIYIEEPVFKRSIKIDHIKEKIADNLFIFSPCLSFENKDNNAAVEKLISEKLSKKKIANYVSWYYSPLAINYSSELEPKLIIYDCMDENCPHEGSSQFEIESEKKLLEITDLIFTSNNSVYEAKKKLSKKVYLFPDCPEINKYQDTGSAAKNGLSDKSGTSGKDGKSKSNNSPVKIGYFGIIDKKFDYDLLDKIAVIKPHWEFVLSGYLDGVEFDTIPKRKNITYLGNKLHNSIPVIVKEWDAAIIPYVKDQSTVFTGPGKVLEYLAAGKKVVSTSINDIHFPFGVNEIVKIADDPGDFVNALNDIVTGETDAEWNKKVDKILKNCTWEKTWKKMCDKINNMLIITNINC
ncbi:glycosyltransferase family 1 protein [soil metagenome]